MKSNASLLKKLTVSSLLIGAGSVSMLSHADATLLVDDYIKVTAINGQTVKHGAFQPIKDEFSLAPGQHAITAKYERLYDLRHDVHDYVRSGNVSVTAELADNQTYRLTMPDLPEEHKAAKDYAERPTLAVQQDNTVIASQQSVGDNQGGLFSGLGKAIGGAFGGSGDAAQQNQQAIAALGQSTTATPGAAQQNTVQQSEAVNTSSNTLDQFMQVWLQATPAEREKISQWIQQ
ncbi:DUF2057 family protein [Psychrobacter sp.]|uniref:DUF2057 family protein n=1 Tax=Psychrobacter sp. TaxID=56811 RepID=UPI00264A0E1F|nr:DUF2057 family protein [Psychrobacter sp.]MDN6308306.1 DUF2057 domain-containing protein [Psychrobacter sp.]